MENYIVKSLISMDSSKTIYRMELELLLLNINVSLGISKKATSTDRVKNGQANWDSKEGTEMASVSKVTYTEISWHTQEHFQITCMKAKER